MSDQPDFNSWVCPLPLRNYPNIVMGHGSGGKMMSDLIKHLFVPSFDNDLLAQMGDSAVLDSLKDLLTKGVEILVCGTCADFPTTSSIRRLKSRA